MPNDARVSDEIGTGHEWPIGMRVTKKKGSSWTGKIVGFYSTNLNPEGYAVESETEAGSVQIYPKAALRASPAEPCASQSAPGDKQAGLSVTDGAQQFHDGPTLREGLEAIADGEGDPAVIAQQTLDANPVASNHIADAGIKVEQSASVQECSKVEGEPLQAGCGCDPMGFGGHDKDCTYKPKPLQFRNNEHPPQEGWRDISTMPMFEVGIVIDPENGLAAEAQKAKNDWGEICFGASGNGGPDDEGLHWQPTHWMPLPSTPPQQGENG